MPNSQKMQRGEKTNFLRPVEEIYERKEIEEVDNEETTKDLLSNHGNRPLSRGNLSSSPAPTDKLQYAQSWNNNQNRTT